MMDFLYSLPPLVVILSMFIIFLAGCSMGYRSGYKSGCDESRRIEFMSWNRHVKRFKCTPRDGVLNVRLDLEKSDSVPEGS